MHLLNWLPVAQAVASKDLRQTPAGPKSLDTSVELASIVLSGSLLGGESDVAEVLFSTASRSHGMLKAKFAEGITGYIVVFDEACIRLLCNIWINRSEVLLPEILVRYVLGLCRR